MIRRIFLFLFFLFFSCDSKDEIKNNLYNYIPSDTVLVVKINNHITLNNIIKNNPIVSSLRFLDKSLFNTLEEITPNKIPLPALFCFTPFGKNKIAITLINKFDQKDSLKNSNKKYSIYNGKKIIEIKINKNQYFKSRINNIQFVSNSKLILENSIRLFENKTKGIQSKDFYNLAEF